MCHVTVVNVIQQSRTYCSLFCNFGKKATEYSKYFSGLANSFAERPTRMEKA